MVRSESLILAELMRKDAELRGLRFEVDILRMYRKRSKREKGKLICIIIALTFALLIFLLYLFF